MGRVRNFVIGSMCVLLIAAATLPTLAIADDLDSTAEPEAIIVGDAEIPAEEPVVSAASGGDATLQSMQTLTDDYRLVVETSGALPEAIGGESVAVADGAYVVEFESAAAQNAAFNALSSDRKRLSCK